jgi:protein required for attachment to host cells
MFCWPRSDIEQTHCLFVQLMKIFARRVHMQTTWFVVADSSRVRIFEMDEPERHLHEIEDMANPQGRATNRDLRTDGYGRYYGKGEREQGHTAPPHVDAVEHETELFSKKVGEYLDKARNEHRYEKLCLIAPPKFMGLIRQNLSKEAQKLVEEEMLKDISGMDVHRIEEYINNHKHQKH